MNLYEALGVARNAKLTDIGRAYNRHKARLERPDTPPDPERDGLIEEAYRTLGDEEARAAYDASLVAPDLKRRGLRIAVMAAAVVAGSAAVLWIVLRPVPVKAPPPRDKSEVVFDAARAVGRVQAIAMSGEASTAGLAFAIDNGRLVGTCRGISPTTQLLVTIATRAVPARVIATEESLGICQLAAEGVGSWPLGIAASDPRIGDKVYATRVDAKGEVTLEEGEIRRVVTEADGRVIEAAVSPLAADASGGPLIDAYGRVAGVAAASADGKVRFRPVPRAWLQEAHAPQPKAVREAAPEPAAGEKGEAGEKIIDPRTGKELSAAERARYEKFRPPPMVNDDNAK